MLRSLGCVGLIGAMVAVTASFVSAQATSTSTESKSFEVIAVNGNDVVARLPEGTRQITVPDSFRFTVNGQQISVHELQPGMTGTATITTRTTVTPVTVTEVKNGTVALVSGSSVYVRTGNDVKLFNQTELDKRGVKITVDGKPRAVNELHTGDQLTAVIVTSRPPRVVSEREVQASIARAAAPAGAAAAGGAGTGAGTGTGGAATRAAAGGAGAAGAGGGAAASRAGAGTGAGTGAGAAGAPTNTLARALPKTAGWTPSLALAGLV